MKDANKKMQGTQKAAPLILALGSAYAYFSIRKYT